MINKIKNGIKKAKRGASLLLVLIVFSVLMVLGTTFGLISFRIYSFSYTKLAKQQSYLTARTALNALEYEFKKDPTLSLKLIKILQNAKDKQEFFNTSSSATNFTLRIPVKILLNGNNISNNLSKFVNDEEKMLKTLEYLGEAYVDLTFDNEDQTSVNMKIVGMYQEYSSAINMKFDKTSAAAKQLEKVFRNAMFLKTPIVNVIAKEIQGDVYIDSPLEYKYDEATKKIVVDEAKTRKTFTSIDPGTYSGSLEKNNYQPSSRNGYRGHTKKRDFFDYDISEPNRWTEVYIRHLYAERASKIFGKEYAALKHDIRLFDYVDNATGEIKYGGKQASTTFHRVMKGNLNINSDALIGLYDKGGNDIDANLYRNINKRGASEHGFGTLMGVAYDYRAGKVFPNFSVGQDINSTYLGIVGDISVNGQARVENLYQIGNMYVTGSAVIDGSTRHYERDNQDIYGKEATWRTVWISGDVYIDGNAYIKNANIGGNVYVAGHIAEIKNAKIGGNLYVLNRHRAQFSKNKFQGNVDEGIVNDDYILNGANKTNWLNDGRYYIEKTNAPNDPEHKWISYYFDHQGNKRPYKNSVPITNIRENVDILGSVKVNTNLSMQITSSIYGDIWCNPTEQNMDGNEYRIKPLENSFCWVNADVKNIKNEFNIDALPNVSKLKPTIYGDVKTSAQYFALAGVIIKNREESVRNIAKKEVVNEIKGGAIAHLNSYGNFEKSFSIFKDVAKRAYGQVLLQSSFVYFKLDSINKNLINGNLYAKDVKTSKINSLKVTYTLPRNGQYSLILENTEILGDLYAGDRNSKNDLEVLSNNSIINNSISIEGNLNFENLQKDLILNGDVKIAGKLITGDAGSDRYLDIGGRLYVGGDIKFKKLKVMSLKQDNLGYAVKALGKIELEDFESKSGSIIAYGDINIKSANIYNGKVISTKGSVKISTKQSQNKHTLVRFLDEDGAVLHSYSTLPVSIITGQDTNKDYFVISEPKLYLKKQGKAFLGWTRVLDWNNDIQDYSQARDKDQFVKHNKYNLTISVVENTSFNYYFTKGYIDSREQYKNSKKATDILTYKFGDYSQKIALNNNSQNLETSINFVAVFVDEKIDKSYHQERKSDNSVETKAFEVPTIKFDYYLNKEWSNLIHNANNTLPRHLYLYMNSKKYQINDVYWGFENPNLPKLGKKPKANVEYKLKAYTSINADIEDFAVKNVTASVILRANNETSVITYKMKDDSNHNDIILYQQAFDSGETPKYYYGAYNDTTSNHTYNAAPYVEKQVLDFWKTEDGTRVYDEDYVQGTTYVEKTPIINSTTLYAQFRQLDEDYRLRTKTVQKNSPQTNTIKTYQVKYLDNKDLVYPTYKESVSEIYEDSSGKFKIETHSDFILGEITITAQQAKTLDKYLPNQFVKKYINGYMEKCDLEQWEGIEHLKRTASHQGTFILKTKEKGKNITNDEFKFTLRVKIDNSNNNVLLVIKDRENKKIRMIKTVKPDATLINSDLINDDRMFEGGTYIFEKQFKKVNASSSDDEIFDKSKKIDKKYAGQILEIQGIFKNDDNNYMFIKQGSDDDHHINTYYLNSEEAKFEKLKFPQILTLLHENGTYKTVNNIETNPSKNIKDSGLYYKLHQVLNDRSEPISQSEEYNTSKKYTYVFRLYNGKNPYKVGEISKNGEGGIINRETQYVDYTISFKDKVKQEVRVKFLSTSKYNEDDTKAKEVFLNIKEESADSISMPSNLELTREGKQFTNKWYFYESYEKVTQKNQLAKKHVYDFNKTIEENYQNFKKKYRHIKNINKDQITEIYLYADFEDYKYKQILTEQSDINTRGSNKNLSGNFKTAQKYALEHPFVQRFIIEMSNGEQIYVDLNKDNIKTNNFKWLESDANLYVYSAFEYPLDEKPTKFDFNLKNIDKNNNLKLLPNSNYTKNELENQIKEEIFKKFIDNYSKSIKLFNPSINKSLILIDSIAAEKDIWLNFKEELQGGKKRIVPDNSGDKIYIEEVLAKNDIRINNAVVGYSKNKKITSGIGKIDIRKSDIYQDILSTKKINNKSNTSPEYAIEIYNSKVLGNVKALSNLYMEEVLAAPDLPWNTNRYTKEEQKYFELNSENNKDKKPVFEAGNILTINGKRNASNDTDVLFTDISSTLNAGKQINIGGFQARVSTIQSDVDVNIATDNNFKHLVMIDGSVLAKGNITIGNKSNSNNSKVLIKKNISSDKNVSITRALIGFQTEGALSETSFDKLHNKIEARLFDINKFNRKNNLVDAKRLREVEKDIFISKTQQNPEVGNIVLRQGKLTFNDHVYVAGKVTFTNKLEDNNYRINIDNNPLHYSSYIGDGIDLRFNDDNDIAKLTINRDLFIDGKLVSNNKKTEILVESGAIIDTILAKSTDTIKILKRSGNQGELTQKDISTYIYSIKSAGTLELEKGTILSYREELKRSDVVHVLVRNSDKKDYIDSKFIELKEIPGLGVPYIIKAPIVLRKDTIKTTENNITKKLNIYGIALIETMPNIGSRKVEIAYKGSVNSYSSLEDIRLQLPHYNQHMLLEDRFANEEKMQTEKDNYINSLSILVNGNLKPHQNSNLIHKELYATETITLERTNFVKGNVFAKNIKYIPYGDFGENEYTEYTNLPNLFAINNIEVEVITQNLGGRKQSNFGYMYAGQNLTYKTNSNSKGFENSGRGEYATLLFPIYAGKDLTLDTAYRDGQGYIRFDPNAGNNGVAFANKLIFGDRVKHVYHGYDGYINSSGKFYYKEIDIKHRSLQDYLRERSRLIYTNNPKQDYVNRVKQKNQEVDKLIKAVEGEQEFKNYIFEKFDFGFNVNEAEIYKDDFDKEVESYINGDYDKSSYAEITPLQRITIQDKTNEKINSYLTDVLKKQVTDTDKSNNNFLHENLTDIDNYSLLVNKYSDFTRLAYNLKEDTSYEIHSDQFKKRYFIQDKGLLEFKYKLNDFWKNIKVNAKPWESGPDTKAETLTDYASIKENYTRFRHDPSLGQGKILRKSTVFRKKLIIEPYQTLFIDTTFGNISIVLEDGIKVKRGARIILMGGKQVYMFVTSKNKKNGVMADQDLKNADIHIEHAAKVGYSIVNPDGQDAAQNDVLYMVSNDYITIRIDEGVKGLGRKATETKVKAFIYAPRSYIGFTGNNRLLLEGSYAVGTYVLAGQLFDAWSVFKQIFGRGSDYSVMYTYNDLIYRWKKSPLITGSSENGKIKYGYSEDEKDDTSEATWRFAGFY